ncbi:multicopper oxidase domain-containing protein [Streptomyces sp. Je 1-79]|uniref:multicopper oxidase family protein n=1 Tax=Streptomyces sp. Je 1-79 TaxID=2943847 RepID=UPI0021A2A1AF|nr:multicopper oxidase domain-containing protein [Streptomyces sp. Je 1-79]MCT4356445.1 multicopper oxidase domain-containing protein [Streptomyces sp. Je 1-79]
MVTRRTAIGAGLAAVGSTLVTGAALTPLLAGRPADVDPTGTATTGQAKNAAAADTIDRFRLAMPVPPVLAPVSTRGGRDVYDITMRPGTTEILPGIRTDVLTYNGSFPGPTLKARSRRPVVVRQRNRLTMPTSVHLHGASVPVSSDGAPMDTIAPGDSRTYVYPNRQPHASLWYHDHAHHMESEHVYRGLAGSYLLTDALERMLPLPTGAYDVPIAIRDARFDAEGQFVYAMGDQARTTILANGKAYPHFKVAARKYRFRLLNSANMRAFNLRLADGSEIVQIGTDGGLLPRPHTTESIFLSAGERADVVIDFSRYPVGTKIVLENTAPPGPADQIGQVLRFEVDRRAYDNSAVPRFLRPLRPLPQPTGERTIKMSMQPPKAFMDDKVYDHERVDAWVRHGASEIWTVFNAGPAPHNFHMHLVQFRVVERNGKDPNPADMGLKDTVNLLPGETVKLQATFDSYRGAYVYHCHMLDHSAMGMMATMKIV